MTSTQPRDVQILPIGLDTLVMRSRTWDRLKFEIEYGLQRGTTANSYLIQAEKTALVDPPGATFTKLFLEQLRQRLDLKKLDYVILGHVNPNRASTLKTLVQEAPQVTFVCSNPGAIALRSNWELTKEEMEQWGISELSAPNILTIRGEETLDLGLGHHLEFIPLPNPRYPDEMATYDPKTNILYTDKLFGAHVCGDQVFDEGWHQLSEDRRYYFDCIHASQARQVETALDRLGDYAVKFYATGHGPLVRYGMAELTKAYRQWAQQQQAQTSKVALLYASAYGNTATVAQAIAIGVTKAGVSVESINCEIATPEEIRTAVEKADGIIMGSPTLGGHAPTPIQTALGIVLSTVSQDKLAGVFGSFGWSGEAIDLIEGKFKDAGLRFGFETIRVKFKPDDPMLKYCEEAGTDFAQALKKSQKAKLRQQQKSQGLAPSQAARIEQAVGRIVGSLSVVTTQHGDVSGAMLASWVSQATFTPPGLTIAVAKERAIESLMHNGGQFVLNILQEGKELRRHFLKNFAPGEDRFQGLETETSSNGSPILCDALAYLECTVQNRMECGDHWLVYAVVDNGKVLHPEGVTAVHHRKTGSYY